MNEWLAKYQGLLSLLTRSCGIDELERSILKLKELEETVGRFYDSEVSVFASEENHAKLTATKARFDLYSQ